MATYNSFFNLDFFSKSNRTINCYFIATDKHEKYMVLFTDEDIYFYSKEQELYSTWTSFFDSQRNSYSLNLLFGKIQEFCQSTVKLIAIATENKDCYLKNYISQFKKLTNYHPFFLMYYSSVYSVVNSILNDTDNVSNEVDNLCQKLNILLETYKKLFIYVINVLVEPFQFGLESGTGLAVIRYERMLIANNQSSPLFLNSPSPRSDWEHELSQMVIETFSLDLYKKDFSATFVCSDDFDYSQQFSRGIQHYIDNDFMLRQCPLCKGYFKTRRTLMISYCNKIHHDNLTCQEIAAKNNYKKKMTSHPIHSAYTRMYNKIYARIRRNTLQKENAKLDELKRLHEQYYVEYENSPHSLKDEILEEFIDEMNNLYL